MAPFKTDWLGSGMEDWKKHNLQLLASNLQLYSGFINKHCTPSSELIY